MEKKLRAALRARAKPGLDSPLWPVLHPCLCWTELPPRWSPACDPAFLKTQLELLNNQFQNTRAHLPFELGFFFLDGLTWRLIPTLLSKIHKLRMQNSYERILISCGHDPASLPSRSFLLSNTTPSDLILLFRSISSPSSLLQKLINSDETAQSCKCPVYKPAFWNKDIWPQDSDGCFLEVHIMMQLHGFKAEGQREMILLSKRSCPHLPGKMHDLKSRNSFLRHWLCAVRVQASTCNLHLRLSTGFFFFLVNQTWLTWSLKILVSVWSDSLGCSQTAGAPATLLSAPPRNKSGCC